MAYNNNPDMIIVQNEKLYNTNLLLLVNSSRLGGVYECHRFREYRIDLDLEVDSNGWDFVFKNANQVYTSLFSRFDEIEVYIEDKPVIKGRVDRVEYSWDDNDSTIHVSGRDMAAVLVDNDALPQTRQNVKPHDYIAEKCKEYGIPKWQLDDSIEVTDKLIIGTGESEISIMKNILLESRKRMWFLWDTVYVGDWSTDAQISYLFTRGRPDLGGTPIKSLKLTEDGTTEVSELIIYGSTNSGENKVTGTAQNDSLISRGIKRRHTKRSYNNDAASKYASSAVRDVRDGFRDNTTVEIKVRTTKDLILPNRTARVIDSVTQIDTTMFIKSVTYSKDATNGSETTITLVLDDKSFEILWAGQGTKAAGGISGTAK